VRDAADVTPVSCYRKATVSQQTSPENTSRAARVEFRLRNNGTLEAGLPLREGQALAPYLASRRGSVNLQDVEWRETGKRVDFLTLAEQEIVWARPLEAGVPLANVVAPPTAAQQRVTVVLAGGQTLEGRFPLIRGQALSEFLSTAGTFPVLRDARLPDDRRLGDVAINVNALRSVREVEEGMDGRALWERGNGGRGGPDAGGEAVAAAGRAEAGRAAVEPLHWLIGLARRTGVASAVTVTLPASTPAVDVWRVLCATRRVTPDELADLIAAELRLQLATAITPDPAAESMIPRDLAERYSVRALADDGRRLVVATIDPMSADAEQVLSFACKRRIVFAVATPEWLDIAPAVTDAESELESLLSGIPSLTGDVVRIEEELDPQGVGTEEVTSEPVIKLANLILREGVRQQTPPLEPGTGGYSVQRDYPVGMLPARQSAEPFACGQL
jgi:hypothetical protein